MKVQITIGGRRYTLRSDEEEDLRSIAAYVDQKMEALGSRAPRIDELSLAVLTALNIASEFERFRREIREELTDLERDVASTEVLVEAALPQPQVRGGAIQASQVQPVDLDISTIQDPLDGFDAPGVPVGTRGEGL
ncbi:MAG TPA: cell division protein ZapA [Deltaproteobacteria bacterium]|nr:cell division protein ZapA [Deltaproteobacteria bacterium]